MRREEEACRMRGVAHQFWAIDANASVMCRVHQGDE